MNVAKMMKDLQKMQTKLQAEIEALDLEASAGGGMVTARMNGKKELTAVRISPEAITPDDPELLQDLVLAAVNEARRRSEDMLRDAMSRVAGPFSGFPFV